MSEEIKKSVEEQVLDTLNEIKETTAAKADASALEAVKESIPSVEGLAKSEDIPSIDGLAKSDELNELKETVEKLDAVVKSAPSVTKGETMSDNIEFKGADFTLEGRGSSITAKATIDFSNEFTKAELGTGSSAVVEGSTVASQRLYYQMQQKNPYRGYATIFPTSGGSVNLPQVTSVTATVENNLPAAALTAGGGISTTAVIPQNWVSRNLFSDQHAEDLPGLDNMVAGYMAQAIARAEAADMVTNLDAASITEVNTGVAADLPTSITPWTDLMAALDSAYLPNAKWSMSRNAYAHLRQTTQGGTGSDLLFDPVSGKMTFLGYEILVNDHLDAGTTAGQNPVYFGDHGAGMIIISRKEMSISRHEDTFPGGLYYYGNMRSRGTVWDANALVRFNVAT